MRSVSVSTTQLSTRRLSHAYLEQLQPNLVLRKLACLGGRQPGLQRHHHQLQQRQETLRQHKWPVHQLPRDAQRQQRRRRVLLLQLRLAEGRLQVAEGDLESLAVALLRGLEERGETGERRGGDLPRELRVRVLELRGGEKDAVVLAKNGLDVVRLVEEEDVVAVVQRRKDEVADVRVQDVLVVQRHDIRLAQ